MHILVITAAATLYTPLEDALKLNISDQITHIPVANLAVTSIPMYDVLVVLSLPNDSSYYTVLKNLILSREKPVLMGYINFSTGTHAPAMLNLAGSSTDVSAQASGIVKAQDTFIKELEIPLNGSFQFYDTPEYITTVAPQGTGYVRVMDSSNGSSLVLYYPKNTYRTTSSVSYPFDIYYIGFLTNRIQMSNVAISYIRKILNSLQEPQYVLKGFIKNLEGAPLERQYSVYNVKERYLLETKTSTSSGEIVVLTKTSEPLFIVVHPQDDDESAQFLYGLIPDPIVA